jgi:hypothetical protein
MIEEKVFDNEAVKMDVGKKAAIAYITELVWLLKTIETPGTKSNRAHLHGTNSVPFSDVTSKFNHRQDG